MHRIATAVCSLSLLVSGYAFAAQKVAFVPQIIGIPYFQAMEAGGKRAAHDLGVE
ncbi:MAG: autoinducer 2 ABC transporter substrate-binding protein, partial [Pantoea sp. Morm]|nr:autoinducer 2 ABC transporter substrate-binding protein [Pantoea sp. Morm]